MKILYVWSSKLNYTKNSIANKQKFNKKMYILRYIETKKEKNNVRHFIYEQRSLMFILSSL